MKYLRQFLLILFISFLGELLKYFLPLPIPASIYGMVILFIGLLSGIIKLDAVKDVGKFLIEIMPVMFIPAGVGLMASWGTLKPVLVPVSVITVVALVAVMGATGRVSQCVIKKSKAKENAPDINIELSQLSGLKEFRLNPNYTTWFKQRSTEHLQLACEYTVFLSNIDNVINNQYKIDFYRNFLVPLKVGKIKKIILDLRGNGGGMVLDARTFTDRFITKDAIFGYQRFKEDNNPFSYTPWTPCMTKTTGIGIKKEIPIVILLDNNSASMSEISTLMLKSQGKHVTVVGGYSAGATAGLGDSDQFNGGIRGKVSDYLEFYMPLLAMQDATHTVIEGIGIKPDLLVDPLTEDEVREMALSPFTHIDRTLKQAIEVLSNN